ncbi:hypothetical protein [Microbacterium sp.]|uniref:hypothetical protein n=1 Tax=Microbacterium sp. TaxID=51671 RepID=UPI003F70E4D9
MSDSPRRALVISYSRIESDPRVRRQIDWLTSDGWIVDTLGLGGHPAPVVADHFELAEPRPWLLTKWGTLLIHALAPRRMRFRRLLTDRVPAECVEQIRRGAYGLVVFNEYEFTPWVADRRDFTPAALSAHLHLDIHEYHKPDVRRYTLGGRLTGHHYRWVRSGLGSGAFATRSVVNEQIGSLYVDEFAVAAPAVVRNIPPFVDQRPSAVRGDEVRLLFHGLASWGRGYLEILEAMRTLPERFTMTFMLMPNPIVTDKLQTMIDEHPARDRIRIVPPAPMREIARYINEYDLEIIFYPPTGVNVVYALPNKFFESIQGRLGVVVGESPAMADIVRRYETGVVVPGFAGSDLEAALAALTTDDIVKMKSRSDAAARELNAEAEGRAFLAAIDDSASERGR